MLRLDRRCPAPASETVSVALSLPFETRQRSRFRAVLDDGTEVAVMLQRGQILRHGEYLCGPGAPVVRVAAAPEPVSEVRSTDPLLLMRASYHLGNRHVPLELAPGSLRYLHDHVLDDMVRGLGLTVTESRLPFEPEAGAYAGGGHAHANGHHHHHHAH
ncbi:MAG: urease accessory protein UreE [Thioalkalivibrio sp.]|nr:MAG: urease accessory protein UreE [Thioalkalivibrio sp.]